MLSERKSDADALGGESCADAFNTATVSDEDVFVNVVEKLDCPVNAGDASGASSVFAQFMIVLKFEFTWLASAFEPFEKV
ncbi:MAG: hypothetical protein ACTHPD_17525 [Rhizomicrobium sp.]